MPSVTTKTDQEELIKTIKELQKQLQKLTGSVENLETSIDLLTHAIEDAASVA